MDIIRCTRFVQASEELALCYYKSITDPEVRGWIYLKDVTEIAEHQDTIILTSVARTLHLYAPTRAQHNEWVTGLAKLCPDAFAMLGRESDLFFLSLDCIRPKAGFYASNVYYALWLVRVPTANPVCQSSE